MITSLKKKVFWSILLSAGGVLLAILVAINVLQVIRTASKQEAILDSAMMILNPEDEKPEGERPPDDKAPGDRRGGGKDKAELLRAVSEDELGVLLLDSNGEVISQAGCADQLEEAVVSAIVNAALTDEDGRGSTEGWQYKAIRNPEGVIVSFLDEASLRYEIVQTLLLSLAAFAMALSLFAMLAWFLARIIVRPVEENTEMQKRFVADASHELKTPLTVIDANVSVLEQSIGQNKWLDYIKEQTGRMSGLVNEMLQLSNLEEAKHTETSPPHEAYDAAEAVLTAALPFESVAFERGVILDTQVPDTLDAYGCRKDLEQLAAILIDNAVKHSEDGGTVKVILDQSTQRHGLKQTQMLELRVSNSGDEIPAEALPHLFDRFYRVDESRTHKDNSYGLGLAIARSLAEKNQGTITVTSQDGITEFTLRLPISS